MIGIPIVTTYITIEAFTRPYRKMWLNVLDLFIMWMFFIVSVTMWYLFVSNDNFIIPTTTITVSFALVVVVIFHILWVTKTLDKIKPKLYILQLKMLYFFRRDNHCPQSPRLKTHDLEGSFFDTYNESREPLLSPT